MNARKRIYLNTSFVIVTRLWMRESVLATRLNRCDSTSISRTQLLCVFYKLENWLATLQMILRRNIMLCLGKK